MAEGTEQCCGGGTLWRWKCDSCTHHSHMRNVRRIVMALEKWVDLFISNFRHHSSHHSPTNSPLVGSVTVNSLSPFFSRTPDGDFTHSISTLGTKRNVSNGHFRVPNYCRCLCKVITREECLPRMKTRSRRWESDG